MKKLFTLIFVLVGYISYGQTDTLRTKHFSTWELSPYLSFNFENTDLEENDPFYKSTPLNLGGGLSLTKHLSHFTSIQANYFNTKFKNNSNRLYYESNIDQFDLRFSLNITNGYTLRNFKNTQLYLYAGYGILWYNTNSVTTVNDVITDKRSSDGTTRVLPLGMGVKYRLGNRTSLYADISYNHTNSDNIDTWNNPLTSRDGYTKVAAGISYTFGKKPIIEWTNPLKPMIDEFTQHDIDTLFIKTHSSDTVYLASIDKDTTWFNKYFASKFTTLHSNNTVTFEFNKWDIRSSNEPILNNIVSLISSSNPNEVIIVGHSDEVGTTLDNMFVSKMRADEIKKYFTDKGINPNILKTEWHGSRFPISKNSSLNRRVEVYIK